MAAKNKTIDDVWTSDAVTLYERHFDDLVQLGRRTAGCRDLAEEAVQEAMIKYCTAHCAPALGKELSYLRSMVINGVRTASRRERRRAELVRDLVPRPTATPIDEVAVGRVTAAQAVDAMRELPEGQRRVMRLRYVHGLSERETADAIGVHPGTVKTQASRGRTALQGRLVAR